MYCQKCPRCGVLKEVEFGIVKFHTHWSRLGHAQPMDPDAYHTKVCRFAKTRGEGCINPSSGYDPTQDFELGMELIEKDIQRVLGEE